MPSIFSLLFIAAMVFPTIIIAFMAEEVVGEGLFWLILFVVCFGLAFIATFFNVCVVYTAKRRFAHGNATHGETFGFAFSRLGAIAGWSLLFATVGILLRLLKRAGKGKGGLGEPVIRMFASAAGTAWVIVTVFVVPGMVYENIGPFAAIKRSVAALRKAWGESLVRVVGLSLTQFIFIILGAVVCIPLLLLVVPCNNKGKKSLGLFFYLLAKLYCEKRGAEFTMTLEEFTEE